ncbi:phenylalanine--tRNA ligase subunit beta [Altererythrobacter sp.]|uniref:phenylalanine--tRNA ligase subunit beta n=1 Tax=Altererythrobacter sp. TaxID=1872480 RepID=UPI001B10F337|nr:phenylalanine--tRNA ligase subunit beta [Altererythrobacter sp.]MBO6608412.1 phenylalanine--tRNA ligase subunit beta [Altererythrobacter sp.]MBO6642074.1 phenylalanine--tRNA ligase subunit beta [Altererythrobacter sp.]MBO6709418.1 phenylalanine--tRNA ligase subunit beta [Altererythrobacter sp.]
MKFSLTWLKDHLETEASVKEIVDTLNAIGLEVEDVEDPAERLAGFTVAKVLTAEKHPDADKLQVLTVDTGSGDPLQVVCGAPNARAGMKGVLGQPGAVVPSNGMELRKSAIRGVESNGMMCSVRELELGDEHDGIIELPEDAPVGRSFADYHGSSPVIDVAITPNRPDCMGVYGIARDLAAAGLGKLKPIAMPEFATDGACPVEIRTDDPEGCPAFYGRVITGVKNGPSPDWLQQRLTSAGQRPISLLVDLTNYVMLAYGRPAHAYDLAKLTGAVVARRAKNGEQVLALNEKTYTLDDSMTVIADDAGVHDVAGIMGGEDSGCSDETTDVLLEIAYFNPARIGVTGRKLGLASDARTRFERGVDPAFLDDGLDLLTGLIVELAGGAASEKVHAGSPPSEPKVISFDTGLTARLGGVDVPAEEQKRILESLDFAVDGSWNVTCPTRRHDIEGAADLVEEVVRIHGLDKVESVALPRADGVAKPTATPEQLTERKLRRAAAASGLNEAITWSFISEAQAESGGGGKWVLDNPISEDMKVMRPSLLPGLLSAVQRNLDRGASSVRLFEIGRRYLEDGERPTLVCVLAGDKLPRGWASGKATAFDAYDAKAICLELLEAAGAPVSNLMVMGEAGDAYHPGQSATLRLGPKNRIASFGMIHPSMLKAYDISVPVAAVGIHLDAIPAKKNADFARKPYSPPSLQAVTRDFAFLVPAELAASDLVRAVKGADKTNIVDARVFDVFAGQGVPEGKKSVAVEVTLQPIERSYKDADLKAISDAIVANAAKQGAELRG